MFDWIKNINKPSPEFWKNYLEKFEKKSDRYVILRLESVIKLNSKQINIACISILNDCIVVKDSLEITVSENETGIVAIENFINYIENATLIGHKIYLEIEILNDILYKMNCGRLKNDVLDIEIMHTKLNEISDKEFSIQELLQLYKLEKSTQHSASDYAFSIALLFLKLKTKLGII